MVVSSRSQENVDAAAAELSQLGISVLGVPCHVAKAQERETLIAKVTKQIVSFMKIKPFETPFILCTVFQVVQVTI